MKIGIEMKYKCCERQVRYYEPRSKSGEEASERQSQFLS